MEELITGLFIIGVVIAGSDGPWWPWANLCGAAMIVVVGAICAGRERK
jgi:hypothetical protein